MAEETVNKHNNDMNLYTLEKNPTKNKNKKTASESDDSLFTQDYRTPIDWRSMVACPGGYSFLLIVHHIDITVYK